MKTMGMMMNRIVLFVCFCFIFLNSVTAAPYKKGVLSPSDDPFYQPPSGFEKEKPGTILKSRLLPPKSLAAFSVFPQNIKNVYQFLYRTTDALGEPITTVTTLMVPYNADPSKLVTYQIMQDSPSTGCSPSQVLRKGDGLKGIISQGELLFIDTLLARGWYVNTADYEGSKAAFTVGAMAGHGILDSVRAVLHSSNQTKIQPDADIQIWGYSGGALASGWATQLQPTYAPELNIIGAALGGTPVDLNATLNAVSGTVFAGLAPSGIIGLSQQYPDVAKYVDSILVPEKKEAFYKAKELCLSELVANYAFQKMSSYVTRPDYTNAPVAKKAMEANVMGHASVPKFPLFMYHAEHDEVVPYAPAANLYTNWCKRGANIQFVKDELSEHLVLYVTGAANAINFLENRFKGVAVETGCSSRTTVTSALDPGALEVFGEAIWNALDGLLGLPIGPGNI
ncbi:putative secretory lipase [Halteromyces radiatus]|uniref:putative secretory lipase n=1 Tax=Halteromyces radiatus TaxID=101107 RepID=UPI00221E4737|nr:putative secretory lipase [Halteromyces radiatus]KAI8086674.1 putative secretory lipase [Halteromyces radiatus]